MPPLTGAGHSIDDLRPPPAPCSRPSLRVHTLRLYVPPASMRSRWTVDRLRSTYIPRLEFVPAGFRSARWNAACVVQPDRVHPAHCGAPLSMISVDLLPSGPKCCWMGRSLQFLCRDVSSDSGRGLGRKMRQSGSAMQHTATPTPTSVKGCF